MIIKKYLSWLNSVAVSLPEENRVKSSAFHSLASDKTAVPGN
jgi:hypothetical protein